MPTPISISPVEIVLGNQVIPDGVNAYDLGDPNIITGVRVYDITGINSGGGGGSVRPTRGMIYPRGIC